NTAMTTITHATTGVTGIGTATGLPEGVSTLFANNTIIIRGTPTVSGIFNYSIPLSGSCGSGVNATGTITVMASRSVTAASSTPTLCINTPLTPITHTTAGVTGIGAASGLPEGVTATWSNNIITISGTPTQSGVFAYIIPLTGGSCGSSEVIAKGTITVKSNMLVSSASYWPNVCVNSSLSTAVTHTPIGNASGIGTPVGLPSGVTASWTGFSISISGTPTVSGIFNYSIPLTGGCGAVSATGTITVEPSRTVTAASSSPTLCINTPLIPITHTTTGVTGIATSFGLPDGVSASFSNNTITISGTPITAGTYVYSISLSGLCGTANATGTIVVTPAMTVGVASSRRLCINTALNTLSISTTQATGIGAPIGLPPGVTATFAGNAINITGTPTVSGIFNYSIPLTGGCGTVNAVRGFESKLLEDRPFV
ncbi:MAG: hypothetical protein ACOVOV_13235, partial [Dolichospermum sp.]